MSKIELTDAEIKFIKWHNKEMKRHARAHATFCYTPSTEEELAIAKSVIDKASALEEELNAYDDDGVAEDLIAWFWEKYKQQQAAEKAKKNTLSHIEKSLLKQCRYYKGEKECPEGINNSLWYYENHWVHHMSAIIKDGKIDPCMYGDIAELFRRIDQETLFDLQKRVPLTLLAILLNRHLHWCYYIEGFATFIKKHYPLPSD